MPVVTFIPRLKPVDTPQPEDDLRVWTDQQGEDRLISVEVSPLDADTAKAALDALVAARTVDLPMSLPAPVPPPTHGGYITLYPYQLEAVEAVFKCWSKKKKPLVVLPCGSGKTILAAEIMSRAIAQNYTKCLFLAHRRELLDQTADKVRLVSSKARVGIVQEKRNELGRHVTIASIDTIKNARRMQDLLNHGPYGMVICDEAHHAVSPKWLGILNVLTSTTPDIQILGMTATPGREDGTGLDLVFDEVAYQKNTLEMIQDGYLVPPVGARVHLSIDLDTVPIDEETGDYKRASLSKLMNTEPVVIAVVEAWRRYGQDRKMAVFAVDVAHAHALAAAFRDAGYTAEAIDGKTKAKDRQGMLDRFRRGETKLLVSCEVLVEGYDDPSMEGIVFARPTQSHTLYSQALGRSLRRSPGKVDALIIDCVGNSDRFKPVQLATLAGFAPDTEVENTGQGRPQEETVEPNVRSARIDRSHDISFRPPRQVKYTWRETSLGWILNVPRIGYYLVAWTNDHRTKATVRFFDQRKGRTKDKPRDIIDSPIDFDLAYGIVEGEMDRIFRAVARRGNPPENDDAQPTEPLVDLDEGVDEELFLPEDLAAPDAEWRGLPVTPNHTALLLKLGVKQKSMPTTRGEASDLITIVRFERDAKMRLPPTQKQLAYFHVNKIPVSHEMTKGKASSIIWRHRKGIPYAPEN